MLKKSRRRRRPPPGPPPSKQPLLPDSTPSPRELSLPHVYPMASSATAVWSPTASTASSFYLDIRSPQGRPGAPAGSGAMVSPSAGLGPEYSSADSAAEDIITPRRHLRLAAARKTKEQKRLDAIMREKRARWKPMPTEEELRAKEWGGDTAARFLAMFTADGDEGTSMQDLSRPGTSLTGARNLKSSASRRRGGLLDAAEDDGARELTRDNELLRKPRVIKPVKSAKTYDDLVKMKEELSSPDSHTSSPTLHNPTTQAGMARARRLEQEDEVWNKRKAVDERFFEWHSYMGDPATHKRLAAQRKFDEPTKAAPPPKKKGLLSLLFSFGRGKKKLTKAQKRHLRKHGKLPPEVDPKAKRKRRRPPPKYAGSPEALRVRNPKRMDHVVELSKTVPGGYSSPAVRGLLRSDAQRRRPKLKRQWIIPIWGWRHWLKRRKPRLPRVEIKVSSALEQAKKKIEAMRLNNLYHVTLPVKLEVQTRRAGLTQKMLLKLRLLFLYVVWDIVGEGDFEIPEIRAMARNFNWIDNDIGKASCEGICTLIDIKYTPFIKAVFTSTTGSTDGKTCTYEQWLRFVIVTGLYTKEELLTTIFNLFDTDMSGALDGDEFKAMADMLNASGAIFPGNFAFALQGFDKNNDGLIDFDEFAELNDNYQMIMWPLFELQKNMQLHTLGDRVWFSLIKQNAKDRRVWDYQDKHGGLLPTDVAAKLRRKRWFWKWFCWAPCCPPLPFNRYTEQVSKSGLAGDDSEDSEEEGGDAGGGLGDMLGDGHVGEAKAEDSDTESEPGGVVERKSEPVEDDSMVEVAASTTRDGSRASRATSFASARSGPSVQGAAPLTTPLAPTMPDITDSEEEEEEEEEEPLSPQAAASPSVSSPASVDEPAPDTTADEPEASPVVEAEQPQPPTPDEEALPAAEEEEEEEDTRRWELCTDGQWWWYYDRHTGTSHWERPDDYDGDERDDLSGGASELEAAREADKERAAASGAQLEKDTDALQQAAADAHLHVVPDLGAPLPAVPSPVSAVGFSDAFADFASISTPRMPSASVDSRVAPSVSTTAPSPSVATAPSPHSPSSSPQPAATPPGSTPTAPEPTSSTPDEEPAPFTPPEVPAQAAPAQAAPSRPLTPPVVAVLEPGTPTSQASSLPPGFIPAEDIEKAKPFGKQWTKHVQDGAPLYVNNITYESTRERPEDYATDEEEEETGSTPGPSTPAHDFHLGLEAEVPMSADRLSAAVAASPLLREAAVASPTLRAVRVRLPKDYEPAGGTTPMALDLPQAKSRMQFMVGNSLGSVIGQALSGHRKFKDATDGAKLPQEYWWDREVEHQREVLRQERKAKKAADTDTP